MGLDTLSKFGKNRRKYTGFYRGFGAENMTGNDPKNNAQKDVSALS